MSSLKESHFFCIIEFLVLALNANVKVIITVKRIQHIVSDELHE